MKKKTLIMLLTSILCIALLPAVAHAATPDVWDGSTASSLTGGGKSEDDPYLISTARSLSCWRTTPVRRGSAAAT